MAASTSTSAIVRLDLKGFMRDNVMIINLVLSIGVMSGITVAGLYKDQLGIADYFIYFFIFSLVQNPGGYGFMFGNLLVEENESGVRGALLVSPVPPVRLLLTRTAIVFTYLIVWSMIMVYVINSTWQAIFLPFHEWLFLIVMMSFLGPAIALALPSYAATKVEALALYKFIAFVTIAPIAWFLLPEEWYRYLLLISPPTFIILSIEAFRSGADMQGYLWALGGGIYNVALTALALRKYLRDSFKLAE